MQKNKWHMLSVATHLIHVAFVAPVAFTHAVMVMRVSGIVAVAISPLSTIFYRRHSSFVKCGILKKREKNTWNKTRARTRIQCNRKKNTIRFQCLFFLCSNEPRISHINLKSLWLCFLLSLEHECNSNRFIALIGLNNDECSSARSMHRAQRSHAPFDDTFWKCKYERITILGAFIAIMALNS